MNCLTHGLAHKDYCPECNGERRPRPVATFDFRDPPKVRSRPATVEALRSCASILQPCQDTDRGNDSRLNRILNEITKLAAELENGGHTHRGR